MEAAGWASRTALPWVFNGVLTEQRRASYWGTDFLSVHTLTGRAIVIPGVAMLVDATVVKDTLPKLQIAPSATFSWWCEWVVAFWFWTLEVLTADG